jgi:hypothetical protein
MNISKREAAAVERAIAGEALNGLNPSHELLSAVVTRLRAYLNQTQREEEAIAYARKLADDDLEIDDEPATSLSEGVQGDEPGCWVAAWVYVSPDELTPESDRDNPRG